jgi:hypothetical protein
MTLTELEKTVGWLKQRARTLHMTGSTLAAQSIVVPGEAPPAPALSVVPPPPPKEPAKEHVDAGAVTDTPAEEAPPAEVHAWIGRAAKVATWLETYKSKNPGRLPSNLSPETLVNLQEVYRLGHQHLALVQIEADSVESLTPAALAPAIIDAAYMLCDHYHIHYPDQLAVRASA